jgi:nucleoside triphosphate pyrophosphatase
MASMSDSNKVWIRNNEYEDTQAVIYLASRSPRRAELLLQLGIAFEVLAPDIDESELAGESPDIYVQRLAAEKAAAAVVQISDMKLKQMPVLAADTTVAVDGAILGKPADDADAFTMLKRMSGRWHEVHTALAVASQGNTAVVLSTTRVEMPPLTDQLIRDYIATGEPVGKAGAYGIQGLAGIFIRRIEGSYSGVMGLPVYETAQLLKDAGIKIL